MGLIYLDSCIVIYLVQRVTPWAERILRALDAEPNAVLATSLLVRMECRVGPLKALDTNLLMSFAEYLAPLTLLPFTEPVFDEGARLRALHGLKTPDALHLACALNAGCAELWTNDARMSRAAPGLVRVLAP